MCYNLIMENELFERLKKYNEDNHVRFHMPGHKGRSEILKDAYAIDVTELNISDNLNFPTEILKDWEDYTASVFGVKNSIFTVNGSSAGIMAAVMYCVKEGEKLLLMYDCHISCYYAAMHAGCDIIRCEVSDNIKGISLDDIKRAVENNKGIKACVITSPTYFGYSCDIENIIGYLKENNIRVIADESHGTHFALSDIFPKSSIEAGADFVVHSAHKSIGALTQTAILHINADDIDERDVRFYLRSVQSTSPSYVLIVSVIEAIKRLNCVNQVAEKLRVWYNGISEIISRLDNFELLQGECGSIDYMKLCIKAKFDTAEFVKILYDEYKIVPEMVYDDKLVFMAGLYSEKSDYDRLADALINTDKMDIHKAEKYAQRGRIPKTKAVLSIKKASDQEGEYIALDESVGRICADYVNVYPPGAPCLIPGEIITKEIVEYIHNSDNVVGIYNNKIKAVKQNER